MVLELQATNGMKTQVHQLLVGHLFKEKQGIITCLHQVLQEHITITILFHFPQAGVV